MDAAVQPRFCPRSTDTLTKPHNPVEATRRLEDSSPRWNGKSYDE
jgi:hypothetical protein